MRVLLFLFLALATSYAASAAATQVGHWRWRNDDGDEITATWKAAMDQQITITDPLDVIRFRVSIYSNTTASSGTVSLQYTTNAAAAAPGSAALGDVNNTSWIDIPSAGTTTAAAFTSSSSNHITGTVSPTTSQLGTSSTASAPNDVFAGGALFTTAYTPSNVAASRRYEVEFTLKPTTNIQNGTVYYFRYKGTSGGVSQVPAQGNYLHGVPNLTTGANVKPTAVAVNLKALLGGAYNTGTMEMNFALADANLLPVTRGADTVTNINTLTVGGKRVTDWVTVAFGKAATPASPVYSYNALLLSDGRIVSCKSPYNDLVFTHVPGDYVITLHQRNHLAVAANFTMTTSATAFLDFTATATTTQNMVGAVKVMWPGDVNQDATIDIADVSAVIASFLNGDFGAYFPGDLDLDTEVGIIDVSVVKSSFLQGPYFDYADL